jgi:hypothetical protein
MNISQRTLSAGVVISTAVLVMTGCASPPPLPKSQETTSSESTLTEEQALALAEDTYTKYLAVSDQIARDGGEGVERLAGLVSENQLLIERQDIELIASKKLRFEGSSRFHELKIQSYNDDQIISYLCLDLSDARLIDKNGNSVGSPMEITPLLVSFARQSSSGFVLSGSESWSGQNYC